MSAGASLTNQLLIAMPGMEDPNFSTTVTLICEHSDEGALGIVINRPLQLQLGGLLEQLQVKDADKVVGAWEMEVDAGGEYYYLTFSLRDEGGKLAGTRRPEDCRN